MENLIIGFLAGLVIFGLFWQFFLKNKQDENKTDDTELKIDLAKRETLNQSSYLANFLIKELKKNMRLLQRTHRFAGFAVLKSLDIPSVLIEMGYLSNPEDSKLLLTKGYQNKIADNILNAVRNYFYWTEQNKG